jgi:glycosyltransferase involved in cell wall biosynthesis
VLLPLPHRPGIPARLCVVTTSYPSHDGDPSGHFVQAEVEELERAGHDVTVVTPPAGGAFGWPGAAFRLRERPWRSFEVAAWLARASAEVRAARPDGIIAHWSIPAAWPIATASGLAGVPLEVVSHGGDIRLIRTLPDALRRRTVAYLARRATVWRFVSDTLLQDLLGFLDHAEASAVRAIASVAASPLTMIDVADEVRAHRARLGDRKLYVCAGRLVASKRVDKVIDYVASRSVARSAAAAAGREVHEPILVVLGDGPERAHLERVASNWRLDARFLGITPRREALSWIGAADELVQASCAEGLSTVVREAHELGVKVTVL